MGEFADDAINATIDEEDSLDDMTQEEYFLMYGPLGRSTGRVRIPKRELVAGDPRRFVKQSVRLKLERNKQQREQVAMQQLAGVNQVAEIEIPQTEAGTGNFYQFPPDVYDAEIVDIEEVVNPFEEGKTQLQFTFEVPGYTNEDGTVASKRGYANPVWNPKSKLWSWAQAILGKVPGPGEPFRTSSLIGQSCRVVLNAGTNQNGEPIIKLTDVLAAKAAAPATNGKAKPGLAARLKADPAAETADVCRGEGCESLDITYTSKGTPYCGEHMP